MIDTAGIDDSGELGKKRVAKTNEIFTIIDLAIIVITDNSLSSFEEKIIEKLKEFDIPFFFIHNKSDIQELEKYGFQSLLKNIKLIYCHFQPLKNPDIVHWSA